MKKYEYLYEIYDWVDMEDYHKFLNKRGEEGWKLFRQRFIENAIFHTWIREKTTFIRPSSDEHVPSPITVDANEE